MELIGENSHNNDANNSSSENNYKHHESKKSESELAESDEEFNLDEEIAREQEEKRSEYYRSNPLRNYASNKGELMVPQLSNLLKKKQLPSIYKDLRENSEQSQSIEIDRNSYKYKLKGDLKVNLTCIDTISKKDKMELRETKKMYTEISRNKVNKPLELKNVQSTLKNTLQSISPVKSQSASNHHTYFSSSNKLNPFASASESNLNVEAPVKFQNEKTRQPQKEPFIEAKSVKINTLDEIADEIKNRSKYKLDFHSPNRVIYDNYDNENVKYTYREKNIIHEHYHSHNQATFDELDAGRDQLPKGTLLSFKQHSAISPGNKHTDNTQNNNKSATIVSVHDKSHLANLAANYSFETKRPSTEKPRDSTINEFILKHEKQLEDNFNENELSLNSAKKNFYVCDHRLVSANTKHKRRVEQAREKVLNANSEKANLNKLTLIQPFEDTKILINLHKVPSKVLNNLFNNKERAKSYLIPPVKAFGYLSHKNVLADATSSSYLTAANTVTTTSAKTMRTATTIPKTGRRGNKEKFNSDSQDSFLVARYLPLSRDFNDHNNNHSDNSNQTSSDNKPKLLSTR